MSSGSDRVRTTIIDSPLQAVSAVLMAVMTVFGLNMVSPWFAPALLVVCVVGMVVTARHRVRAERIQREGERLVNYAKLNAIDVDKLLPWLQENVRGHDPVLAAICQHLKKSLQLARSGRTLGNFVLVGPTGTGKTFLAQLVGSGLFPSSELVLLNMNQYRQPGDVYTLIGPPPGMPGCETGGRLTHPVLENPYRVIVFSELDKAHRELHDCLHEILDTGTCRDKSSGRLVDFSGCVFFATSNVGVDKLRALPAEVGDSTSSSWLGRSRDALAEAGGFDRAFLSRWDGVYLLDQLPPIHVAEVACFQLCRYWQEYGIEIGHVAPELICLAVQRNQDFAEYGVRQMGRIIREITEAAVVEAKRRGATKVNLDVDAQSGHVEIEVP
jgi:ATP-dependent Clp protease ATP-binding subunit ClpC